MYLYTILQDTTEESTTDPQAQIDGGSTPNTYVDLLPETVRFISDFTFALYLNMA